MHQCANHPLPDRYGRAFLIGIVLNVGFVALEGAYGYATDSLALLADAGHNLSDVLGLVMAWAGYSLAKLPPSPRYTYGWRASTTLAALFNSLLLMAAIIGIAWEAIQRFQAPSSINTTTVIAVALIGVLINTGTALLFVHGRKEDLNLRGAYLHMAADALLSLGVVVAGIIIHFTGFVWLDPLISLVIASVILVGTWSLFRESLALALHAVPKSIDPLQVRKTLANFPGVTEVNELHIWAISTTETSLTVHLKVTPNRSHSQLLRSIQGVLHDQYSINDATIQLEDCKELKKDGHSKTTCAEIT